MRQPILLMTALVLGCGGRAPAPPAEPQTAASLPTGAFTLHLASEAPWHRNALTFDAATRRGVVTIDLGIGPEGRAPTMDEVAHEAPFEADGSSDHLSFAVTIGTLTPRELQFDLWPCPEAGDAHCSDASRLQGTARIDGRSVRATADTKASQ